MTLANFQISGKMPHFNDELNTMVSGFQMKSAASLISLVEILSGPGALPSFSYFMAFSTYVSSIGTNAILFC